MYHILKLPLKFTTWYDACKIIEFGDWWEIEKCGACQEDRDEARDMECNA